MTLLTPREAAKALGMTTGALRQAVQRGAIVPTQRTVGGQARYSPEAINAIKANELNTLNTQQAAKALGMKPKTLQQAVLRGTIVPSSRTGGGRARYSPDDIKAILARVRPGKSPGSKFKIDGVSKSREPNLSADDFIRRALFKYRLARGMIRPDAPRKK